MAGSSGVVSATPDPIHPALTHGYPAVAVARPPRPALGRSHGDEPEHPYRDRALALWPGLDRARLRRCGDDLAKVVRLVAHTTCESADVIEAMLCCEPTAQVVMPPIRRATPIPIDPYVVLPTGPRAVDIDGTIEDALDEDEDTAAPPRRVVTSHDIPWVPASAFGRDGEHAGSA